MVTLADDTQQSAYPIATSEVGDDPRLLELTLNSGADLNARDGFNGTGLIRAGEGNPGDQATVAALVAGGVAVNIPDGRGTTALAHAEQRGQREVAAILRAAGATG